MSENNLRRLVGAGLMIFGGMFIGATSIPENEYAEVGLFVVACLIIALGVLIIEHGIKVTFEIFGGKK